MTESVENLITVSEAQQIAKEAGFNVTLVTIYAWAKRHGIGFQAGPPGEGGPWRFYKDKLEEFLQIDKGDELQ